MPKPKTRKPKHALEKRESIDIYPGIRLVAERGANAIVFGALVSRLDDLRSSFVDEQIAEALGRDDDRYAIAELLRKEPGRLDEIANIIRAEVRS